MFVSVFHLILHSNISKELDSNKDGLIYFSPREKKLLLCGQDLFSSLICRHSCPLHTCSDMAARSSARMRASLDGRSSITCRKTLSTRRGATFQAETTGRRRTKANQKDGEAMAEWSGKQGRFQYVNQSNHAAKDALEGLVRCRNDLKLVKDVHGGYVVVQKDMDPHQVAVLSGGGSGHEPFAGGLVGQGMLSAAVAGDVFASPSARAVMTTLQYCDHVQSRFGTDGAPRRPGAVMIVLNYMGDRLHFGMSIAKAQAQGMQVRQVVVSEDCALSLETRNHPPGPRGLAVAAVVAKVAGASAARGDSVDKVADYAQWTVDNAATVGMSASSCALPGQRQSLREVEAGAIEFGLGIHGEPGAHVARDLKGARGAVQEALAVLLGAGGLRTKPGENVVILVNGLGGLSHLELQLVAGEVLQQLENTTAAVPLRCFVGDLVTSLDTAGLSITILRAEEEILKLLDAPATPACWPFDAHTTTIVSPDATKTVESGNEEAIWVHFSPPVQEIEKVEYEGATTQDTHACQAIRASLVGAAQALVTEESRLNALDAAAGDGDCGTTMADVSRAVLASLGANPANASQTSPINKLGIDLNVPQTPSSLLELLAELVQEAIGGTSGALYYIGLLGALPALHPGQNAESSRNTDRTPDSSCLADALDLAVQAIMQYGSANPGDRTMLDALVGARDAAQRSSSSGADMLSTLEAAAVAAQEKADETAGMVPRVGRASYAGSRALGNPDAGASAVAVWLRGATNALKEKST